MNLTLKIIFSYHLEVGHLVECDQPHKLAAHPPEMDIGQRAAKIVASRVFLTLSRGSLGFFIPVRAGRKGFYRCADRFRARSGPRAAVVMSPEAPKWCLKWPSTSGYCKCEKWSFGAAPRGPARLTACLLMVLTGGKGFAPAATRSATSLLAGGVGSGLGRVVYPPDHAWK